MELLTRTLLLHAAFILSIVSVVGSVLNAQVVAALGGLVLDAVVVFEGRGADGDVVVAVAVGPDPEEPWMELHDVGIELALEQDVLALEHVHGLSVGDFGGGQTCK